jgi:hypothetical protein
VAARSPGQNPNITADLVGRLFFPQSKSLGLDRAHCSNAILAKITYAGSNNTSYQSADANLAQLAELTVSDKQVRRICQRIGGERVAERDAAVAAYQALPLVQRKAAPAQVVPPPVVAVGVDGGRLQILERHAADTGPPHADAAADAPLVLASASAADADTVLATPSPLAASAAEPQPAVDHSPAPEETEDDEAERGNCWREDKIGLLLTLNSEERTHDPCPSIPPNFLNPIRMSQLVRELKKRAPPQDEAAKQASDVSLVDNALAENETRWQPPPVQSKRVVATRRPWEQFGPMVAEAAWQLGFFAAERKAFIGDGAETNWTLHRSYFSSFVGILDFIHALSYVFAAALAGRDLTTGWQVYTRWITWVWSGEVEQMLTELTLRQAELGSPAADEPAASPRAVVARAWTYLQNNQGRMQYAEYRRLGLPMTSSHVESMVKQINYRVKGTEKFWNEAGAEPILQLRADYLSDGGIIDAYWKRREDTESGQNRYRTAV